MFFAGFQIDRHGTCGTGLGPGAPWGARGGGGMIPVNLSIRHVAKIACWMKFRQVGLSQEHPHDTLRKKMVAFGPSLFHVLWQFLDPNSGFLQDYYGETYQKIIMGLRPLRFQAG